MFTYNTKPMIFLVQLVFSLAKLFPRSPNPLWLPSKSGTFTKSDEILVADSGFPQG